jgi:cathepsin L
VRNKGRLYKVKSFLWAQPGNDSAVMEMLDKYGPMAVAIDASSYAFGVYKSGVYAVATGLCSSSNIDHAVLLVGYGIDNSTGKSIPYWKIKNQWGTSWGMNGYMLMARNRANNCGITGYAMFPIL